MISSDNIFIKSIRVPGTNEFKHQAIALITVSTTDSVPAANEQKLKQILLQSLYQTELSKIDFVIQKFGTDPTGALLALKELHTTLHNQLHK
jgi:hypothetical protein